MCQSYNIKTTTKWYKHKQETVEEDKQALVNNIIIMIMIIIIIIIIMIIIIIIIIIFHFYSAHIHYLSEALYKIIFKTAILKFKNKRLKTKKIKNIKSYSQ